MSLIKWEPFDEFDRIFREMSVPALRQSGAGLDLACDVYEDGNSIVAEMNLPGLEGENIDVEVDDDRLYISGTREEVSEDKQKDYYSKEIRRGSFERVVPLPSSVDEDKTEAEYEDGVLKVRMPKKEGADDKRVKVQVKK